MAKQATKHSLGALHFYCSNLVTLHMHLRAQRGKNKNDVASTVESYMKEHGATGEEAMAAIKTMVEQAWRRINGACMELGRTMQPALQWLVAMTRMLEVFYLHGRDGLTYGYDIKEIVAFLFLKQVPV